MARVCDLTGKRRQVGHKVSHSNIKTKKQSQPNLKSKKVYDPITGQTIRLKLSTKAMKSLDKAGSLSQYLRKNAKFFI